MGLADYFHRSAVAAAQVLDGYDEGKIAESLQGTVVGISISSSELSKAEGYALTELLVRLIARFYPRVVLEAAACDSEFVNLALAVNPELEINKSNATVGVVIGDPEGAGRIAPVQVFAGSQGWDAMISTVTPQPVGVSNNPFGAGASACLAAANVFRYVFSVGGFASLDVDARLSTLECEARSSTTDIDVRHIDSPVVLVGAGAIGSAVVWALSRLGFGPHLHVVDPEVVELGNLQRYVTTNRKDVGRSKVELACEWLVGASGYQTTWDHFVATSGYKIDRVLVAVDSATARRAVQATLPRWIANGWTQAGDLGVSVHPWSDDGACLNCLYNPAGTVPNEDELIAEALNLSHAEDGLEIRRLLHSGTPPSPAFLEKVAQRLDRPLELLMEFENRPLRDLYVQGVCGGAVIPLDRAGRPTAELHVPLAHQSALAGVLLAARLVADVGGFGSPSTLVTRIDVQRSLSEFLTQPALKEPRGICICQDDDYRAAWRHKYIVPDA